MTSKKSLHTEKDGDENKTSKNIPTGNLKDKNSESSLPSEICKDKKIFLVRCEHRKQIDLAYKEKAVALTPEELEHMKKIFETEIEDLKLSPYKPCKKCELILKKLEGIK